MCVFLVCVIVGLNQIDAKYLKNSTVIRFYIEYASEVPFSAIHAALRREEWHLSHLEYLGCSHAPINSAILEVQRSGQNTDAGALLETLRNTMGVLFAEDV